MPYLSTHRTKNEMLSFLQHPCTNITLNNIISFSSQKDNNFVKIKKYYKIMRNTTRKTSPIQARSSSKLIQTNQHLKHLIQLHGFEHFLNRLNLAIIMFLFL